MWYKCLSIRLSFSSWKNKAVLLNALKFQMWFTVLEFLVPVSGESHYATTILSPSIPGSADRMTWQWQSSRKRQRLYLRGEINKPLSHCLSVCLPVYLHVTPLFSFSGHLSSGMFVTPVCGFLNCPITCLSIAPACLRHRVCLPAFISSSVSVQPDLPVVPGLFQSVTGWLTDLWDD